MYSATRLYNRFQRERARDPNRDYRANLITDMRLAGISMQREYNQLSTAGLKFLQKQYEDLSLIKDKVNAAYERGGYGVSVPVLRHISYHAPSGSMTKDWCIKTLIEHSLLWSETELNRAAEDIGKACRFKYEDEQLDAAVVPVFIQLMKRIADEQSKVKAAYNLRDTAYLAIHNSLLERESSKAFYELMQQDLLHENPDKFMLIYSKSLCYPEPNTALEEYLRKITKEGATFLASKEKKHRVDLFRSWNYPKPSSDLREDIGHALSVATAVPIPTKTM